MEPKKSNTMIGFVAGAIAVVVATIFAGFQLQLFTGFPKGVDAYAHMTRIVFILQNFPQIHWNPLWDSGTFFWIWTYPPLTALLSALLIKLTGMTVAAGMTVAGSFLMVLAALGLYFACFVISKRLSIALAVTILTVTTPAFWSWWGHGGNYARIWGMAFYFWAFAILVWYRAQPGRLRFFLLAIATSLALGSHLLYGGLTFLTFGAYVLFAASGVKNKMVEMAKVFGVSILLCSYWYFPLFLTSKPKGRYIEGAFGGPVSFKDLFSFDALHPYFSLPSHVMGLIIFGMVLGIVLLIKKRYDNPNTKAVIFGLGCGVIGSLFYILMGNIPGYPEKGYLAVFPPFATLPLLIFFSAYFLSAVLSSLSKKWALLVSGGMIVVTIVSYALQLPYRTDALFDVSQTNQRQYIAQQMIGTLPLSEDYRFGTDSAFVGDWFNVMYPHFPQTRDYIYQGVPFKVWQYFQEYVVWAQPERYRETEWLLDWYGVKYFSVGYASANTQYDKFLSKPELFTKKGENAEKDFYVFEYLTPKPILEASNAKPVLVFGTQEDFETVVRTTALIGWGTDRIVPVYGGLDLGGFTLEKLRLFPTIFLYRTKKTPAFVDDLIKEYAEAGGRVVVEAPVIKEAYAWPSWSPVETSSALAVEGNWDFGAQAGVLAEVTDEQFARAEFSGNPWNVAAGTVKTGSDVLLASHDQPVVVTHAIGSGSVVWSGMNLAYHAESKRNEVEATLLMKLFGVDGEVKTIGNVAIVKNQPEVRTWKVTDKAAGVVWKESFFPRWSVIATDSNNKKFTLTTFQAGPHLSYIPLPQDASYPITIEAHYQQTFLDIAGWVVTAGTLILLIFYVKTGSIFPKHAHHAHQKVYTKVGKWWEEE